MKVLRLGVLKAPGDFCRYSLELRREESPKQFNIHEKTELENTKKKVSLEKVDGACKSNAKHILYFCSLYMKYKNHKILIRVPIHKFLKMSRRISIWFLYVAEVAHSSRIKVLKKEKKLNDKNVWNELMATSIY